MPLVEGDDGGPERRYEIVNAIAKGVVVHHVTPLSIIFSHLWSAFAKSFICESLLRYIYDDIGLD